jgi:hypothetical protein
VPAVLLKERLAQVNRSYIATWVLNQDGQEEGEICGSPIRKKSFMKMGPELDHEGSSGMEEKRRRQERSRIEMEAGWSEPRQ